MIKLSKNQKNILLALIPVILILFYLPIDRPFFTNYSFKTAIDDWIPLLTIFIIFYISYYFYLLFAFFYLLKRGESEVLRKTVFSMTVTILSAYLFYFFFQNSVHRPLIVSEDIFDDLYIYINNNVPPYNAFPSLHVALSIVVLDGFKLLKVKFYKWVALWTVLIFLSTIFTKQHYALDVIGGLFLALLSIRLASINRYKT